MYRFKETVKVKASANGLVGRAKWYVQLNPDNSVTLDLNLPGNQVLNTENVSQVALLQRKAGWQSPSELAKTAGVTLLSLLGGGILIEWVGESDELLQALIGLASIATPSGYGAVTLSRKTVRLAVSTNDGKSIVAELPEYLALLILGFYTGDGPSPGASAAETFTEVPA